MISKFAKILIVMITSNIIIVNAGEKLIDFNTTGKKVHNDVPAYVRDFRRKISSYTCSQLEYLENRLNQKSNLTKTIKKKKYYNSLVCEVLRKREVECEEE